MKLVAVTCTVKSLLGLAIESVGLRTRLHTAATGLRQYCGVGQRLLRRALPLRPRLRRGAGWLSYFLFHCGGGCGAG